jgi:putative GTP pyrophosphokinase
LLSTLFATCDGGVSSLLGNSMTRETDWLKWFENNRRDYEAFTSKVILLMTEILDVKKLNATIEGRTKTIESFSEKLRRVGKSYESATDITDISAIRVIVKTKSDLELLSSILESEFDIDPDHSVDKSSLLDSNEFGYLSEHYVATISTERSKMLEWKRFSKFNIEIQARTILQHAWASVSHSIDYKSEVDIPKVLRRRFFRLSALFELADEELDSIAKDSLSLYKSYESKIISDDNNIELNVDSLKAYLEKSESVHFWSKYISDLGVRVGRPGAVSRDVEMAKAAGLISINDIEHLIDPNTPDAEKYLKEFFVNTFGTSNPEIHSMDINGLVTLFLIAKYPKVFTDEVLDKKYGWGKPERATIPARKYFAG